MEIKNENNVFTPVFESSPQVLFLPLISTIPGKIDISGLRRKELASRCYSESPFEKSEEKHYKSNLCQF